MPVFVVVPLAVDVAPLEKAVMQTIAATDRHKMQNDRGWLVSFNGTSQELSDHIGVTGGVDAQKPSAGSALVAPIGSYYGRGKLALCRESIACLLGL